MEQKYSFDQDTKLGKGSYGKVYRGYLKSDKSTQVAIKQIERDEGFFSSSAKKEIEILKSLNHGNIVCLLDDYKGKENIYIVMEYCDAGNLEEFVKKHNPDASLKLQIMHDCSRGVSFMHNQSPPIIHRDLKPQNVLLKIERCRIVAKLCDFGISRTLISDDQLLHTDCGTPYYRAPELMVKKASGKLQYSIPADIFSLGLVYQVVLLYKNGGEYFEPTVVGYHDTTIIVASIMVQFDKDGKEPPSLFDTNPNEDRLTASLKTLVIRMTAFKATDRMAIGEVELTLHRLVEKDQLCESCAKLKLEIESLKDQQVTQNRAIASLERSKARLQIKIEELQVANATLQKERACERESLEAQNATQITTISSLQQRVAHLQIVNEDQSMELNSLRSQKASFQDELKKIIANNNKNELQLITSLSEEKKRNKQLQAEKLTLQKESAYEREFLEAQNATQSTTISSLQDKIIHFQTQEARLQDHVSRLEAEVKKETENNKQEPQPTTDTELTDTSLDSSETEDERKDLENVVLEFPPRMDARRIDAMKSFPIKATVSIGMKYSSSGLAFLNNPSAHKILKWSDCTRQIEVEEVPFSVLTDDNGAFIAFGYLAEQMYSRSEDKTKLNLFRGLDIWRNKNQIIRSEIRATNGKSRNILDIVSMALKYIFEHLMEKIKSCNVQHWDVQWIVVLPSIMMHGGASMKEALISEVGRTFSIKEEPEALISCFEHTVGHNVKGCVLLIDINEVNTILRVCRLPWIDGSVCETTETCGQNSAQNLLVAFLENKLLGSCAEEFNKSHNLAWELDSVWKQRGDETFIAIPISYSLANQLEEYFGKDVIKATNHNIGDNITFSDGNVRIGNKVFNKILGPVISDVQECALTLLQKSNNYNISSIIIAGKTLLREVVKDRLVTKVPKTISVSTIESDNQLVRGALALA